MAAGIDTRHARACRSRSGGRCNCQPSHQAHVFDKRTGRRIFRMAPIHHHFEQLGWKESTVVIRFWIIAIVLAVLGLATLKLR